MTQQDADERRNRLRRIAVVAAVVTFVIALFVTLALTKPAMPDRITLLTGPEGTAYHELGERYAVDLRRRGLEADVVVTAGAFDNLRRLADDDTAVGFAPSTVDRDNDAGVDASRLVALGSVGLEPVWLFWRAELDVARLPDLAGATMATGGVDTLSGPLARRLLAMNGLADDVELVTPIGDPAKDLSEGLALGTIDAAIVTGDAGSPLVRTLLDADGVRLASVVRADAYGALLHGVIVLTAPEGVFDLARNIPARDTRVLSATTCLVAHEDLHPAIAPMVLIAAGNERAETTAFTTAMTFPSADHISLPLDTAARRYFSQGETGLSRFLPYKVTRFLHHLGFLVIPVLTVVAILLKIVPTGLRIWGSLRLKALLKELEAIDKANAAGGDRVELLARLRHLDDASAKMFVPRSVVHDYVDCRQFVADMRDRIG